MDIVKTNCPTCGHAIELPRAFDNFICARCGTAYHVREHKGAINLSAIGSGPKQSTADGPEKNAATPPQSLEENLTELDEMIAEASSQIEAIKGYEQAAPLQLGCAVFGMFMLVIMVIALFMPLGRDYFGGWLFYLSLVVVILVGLMRLRRKLALMDQAKGLVERRAQLEQALSELQAERDSTLELKEKIAAKRREASAGENGG
jgi:ribosomal protein S27AE